MPRCRGGWPCCAVRGDRRGDRHDVGDGVAGAGSADGKALAALAGVGAASRDSAQPAVLRRRRRHIAQALYQMAMTAVRWDPAMRAHYQQLRARRRPHKVAIVAVARRMLGILNAMVRDGLTWQQTRVGQGAFLPDRTAAA